MVCVYINTGTFTNSQPVSCPITHYYMKDTSDNLLSHARVTWTNTLVVNDMKFTINDAVPFTLNVRLHAYTMFKNAHSSFLIRVCGEETPYVVNSAYKLFVYGRETSSSSRYEQLPESTFSQYFGVQNAGQCSIDHYELLSSTNPDVLWNGSGVSISGSLGSMVVTFDRYNAMNS
jgi:hypothetical protein